MEGLEAGPVVQSGAHWEGCQLRAQRKGVFRDKDRGQWGEGEWPQQEELSEEAACRRQPHSVTGRVPGPRRLQDPPENVPPSSVDLSCLGWSPSGEPSLWVP